MYFTCSVYAPNTKCDRYWCDFVAICLLSNDIMDYHIVSQGKTIIPGVDDGEEMRLTDVSPECDNWLKTKLLFCFSIVCFAYNWLKTLSACGCQIIRHIYS